MKAKYIWAIALLILIPLFSAGLAWLGGFDFDRRGGDVAVWTFMTAYIAIAAAILTVTFSK